MADAYSFGVLVVSDDPQILDAARGGFSDDVYVHEVFDAREALAWMQEQVPDCVVIDIQTGSAGGFSLARDMAADRYLSDVPTVMLLEREQDRWLANQAGATAIMIKPVDPADLPAEVLRHIPEVTSTS